MLLATGTPPSLVASAEAAVGAAALGPTAVLGAEPDGAGPGLPVTVSINMSAGGSPKEAEPTK